MSKIDWTKWSAIAEVLSAFAIFATLLYLAVQTHYVRKQTALQIEQNEQNIELLLLNNELLQAQAGYNLLQNRSQFRNSVITDPGLAEFWVESGLYGDVTAVELMVRYRNERNILNWQWEWGQYMADNLAFGEFSIPLLRDIMSGAVQAEFEIWETWESFKDQLDPAFVEWMEMEIIAN